MTLKEAAADIGCSPGYLHKIVSRSRQAANGWPVDGPTVRFRQLGPRGNIKFESEDVERLKRDCSIDPANPKQRPTITSLPARKKVNAVPAKRFGF